MTDEYDDSVISSITQKKKKIHKFFYAKSNQFKH
jgi:hypothetical protein